MEGYIKITGLKVYAGHGVFSDEKENGQDFYLNAKLYYDMKRAVKSDTITQTINYAEVCVSMAHAFLAESVDLIETAAERVCEELLSAYVMLHKIELEVCKPKAPIAMEFENISVVMTKQWHKVYLSVGSNIGNREQFIRDAAEKLEQRKDIRKVKLSSLVESKPYGPVAQEDFLNACISLETWEEPEELLEILHEIEDEAGRERKVHWGPRTLDLDILFFDKLVYESDTLVIPHVDLQNRMFVLEPLTELCPNLHHPVLQKTVMKLYEKLDRKEKDKVMHLEISGQEKVGE